MTSPQGAADFAPASIAVPSDVQIGQVLTGTQAVSSGSVVLTEQITMPSYLVCCAFSWAATPTVPFATVQLSWEDPSTLLDLDLETWTVPGSDATLATSTVTHTGRGPTRAGLLAVTVWNNDPAKVMTYNITVYQSSRVITRADWRQIAALAVPNFAGSNDDPTSLILGSENGATLAASGSDSWLCDLWAGPAWLTISQSPAETLHVFLLPQDPQGLATVPYGYFSIDAAGGLYQQVTLPRCPVQLQINNTSATATSVTWSLIAQETAS